MRHERISISNGAWASPQSNGVSPLLGRWLLSVVAVATLFFIIVTPPFQAPDENQHYMKALLLSEGRMLAEQRDGQVGAYLPRAALDLHAVDFPTDIPPTLRRFDRAALSQAWSADAGRPGRSFGEFPNVANYAPTLYAPGAAGLMLGDALGLPRLGSFYLGRLVNALTGLGLLILALRLLPLGRSAMLAIALLPTYSHQTGSLSPDGIINGLGFLGLALSLRAAIVGSGKTVSAGLAVSAPLLALAKGIYLPLLAAGLRLPEWRRDMRPWLLLAVMGIGAAAFVGWMKYSGGSPTLYHIMDRKTGANVLTAPMGAQLAVILADPVGYLRILFTSIAERMPVYLVQIVGRLGWNAILLPLVAYPIAALMLAGAVMSGLGMRVSARQRLWWLLIAGGGVMLTETALYLTGTPLGAHYIQGTQGRYFLPFLPLALIAVMPARGGRWAPWLFAGAALLLLLIAWASAYDSFWVHGFITTDGMPPHGGIASALLFPSPRW